ncbi:MAG: hypothetical protein ABUS79_12615, partial [Pseudomonadota bacterium]
LGRIGGSGGTDWTTRVTCPANTVVTAISGSADDLTFVDRLRVSCSSLNVAIGPNAVTTVFVSDTASGGMGGKGDIPFAETCPANQVVSRVFGNGATNGTGFLDRLGFACTTPSVVPR